MTLSWFFSQTHVEVACSRPASRSHVRRRRLPHDDVTALVLLASRPNSLPFPSRTSRWRLVLEQRGIFAMAAKYFHTIPASILRSLWTRLNSFG